MPETPSAALPLRDRVDKILARAFYGVYFVCFGWVVLNIAFTTTENSPANILLAALMLLGLCLLYRAFGPRADALPKKTLYLVVGVSLGLYAVVQLWLGYLFMNWPLADVEWLMEAAWEWVENGRLTTYNAYFLESPNNLGLLVLLYALYKPLSLFGMQAGSDAALYAGTVLNVVLMNAAVFFVWRAASLLFKRQSQALLALLMCYLFAPYVLFTAYTYTDPLSMVFPVAALAVYLKARTLQGRGAVIRYAVAGLVLAAGYWLKGSVAIALVAILLHLALTARPKQLLLGAGAMLAAFAVLVGGLNVYVRHCGWFDADGLAEKRKTTSTWLAMGAHYGDGYCPCERCWEIRGIPDYDSRNAAAWAFMRESYAAYTETELTEFLTYKAVRAWGHGDYDALGKIRTAKNGNWTHAFIIPGGAHYPKLTYYCNAYNLMLLASLLVTVFCGLRSGRFGRLTVVQLALFGAFVFFLFWENQMRYILTFTPLLVLAASQGVASLSAMFMNVRRYVPSKNSVHSPD